MSDNQPSELAREAVRRELLGECFCRGVSAYWDLHRRSEIKPSIALAGVLDPNSEWYSERANWAGNLVKWAETKEVCLLLVKWFGDGHHELTNKMGFMFFRGFLAAAQSFADLSPGSSEGFPTTSPPA